MTLAHVFNRSVKIVKSNSPEILTGLGIAGVISTSYLSVRAGMQAAQMIDVDEQANNGRLTDTKERLLAQFKLTWKSYIPPATAGIVTIACIVGSHKASGSRTAAAVTAYTVAERAMSEYKEKVIEQLGENKERKIHEEIIQEKVSSDTGKDIVYLGKGDVLCCEMYTRRYFKSDMETLKKAQNAINYKIVNEHYVTLSELYDILDLDHTTDSDLMGWDSDKLLEFNFTSVLAHNEEPCLAFEYNYIRALK